MTEALQEAPQQAVRDVAPKLESLWKRWWSDKDATDPQPLLDAIAPVVDAAAEDALLAIATTPMTVNHRTRLTMALESAIASLKTVKLETTSVAADALRSLQLQRRIQAFTTSIGLADVQPILGIDDSWNGDERQLELTRGILPM